MIRLWREILLNHDRKDIIKCFGCAIGHIRARFSWELPEFVFDRFIDNEQFVIAVQSKFQSGEDRDLVLQFADTVEDSTAASYGDDRVSQKATVKTGLHQERIQGFLIL